jgi:hypothetical protein
MLINAIPGRAPEFAMISSVPLDAARSKID